MRKRIILCGAAGSGKDYMRKKLESRGFKYAVSYTTRPPREGEVEGQDYFFLSDMQAIGMATRAEFFEYVNFNDWLYGTTNIQWNTDDLFIMTPSGIKHINHEDRKNCLVIFIDIDNETRRKRLYNRSMPGDSVERRVLADENDFKDFTDYDVKITNPDF